MQEFIEDVRLYYLEKYECIKNLFVKNENYCLDDLNISHKNSMLGKWIYSVGIKSLWDKKEHRQILKRLMDTHTNLHSSFEKLVHFRDFDLYGNRFQENNMAGLLQSEIQQMEQLTKELMDLLDNLEERL